MAHEQRHLDVAYAISDKVGIVSAVLDHAIADALAKAEAAQRERDAQWLSAYADEIERDAKALNDAVTSAEAFAWGAFALRTASAAIRGQR